MQVAADKQKAIDDAAKLKEELRKELALEKLDLINHLGGIIKTTMKEKIDKENIEGAKEKEEEKKVEEKLADKRAEEIAVEEKNEDKIYQEKKEGREK